MKANFAFVVLLLFVCAPPVASADLTATPLDELALAGIKQGWGPPQAGASVLGVPLRVAGKSFASGIGTHAPAKWTIPLGGKAREFRAAVGVQEYPDNPGVGTLEFIVRGDGREFWRSGIMSGRDAAKGVRVSLVGLQELALEVTDGGDGSSSDHADWLGAVIVHDGAPLPLLPAEPTPPDEPGDPVNGPASVDWSERTGTLRLRYDGRLLFEGSVSGGAKLSDSTFRQKQAVTQTLTFTGQGLRLRGVVSGSAEAIAAETRGSAQERFPLIRTTSGGPSRNRRNDALYDRQRDWLLAGATRIEPKFAGQFTFEAAGDAVTISFKPRFYQRHKNIAYFRPWTYRVRQDSITGWCSWWAFMRNCSQVDCDELLAVWKEKRFADYGYRFIQLDDCFQNEFGKGQSRKVWPPAAARNGGYVARGPATWLDWRKDSYPAGMKGYVAACRDAGFAPGVWIGTFFTDDELLSRRPTWFVRGPDGQPFAAPWSSCGVDATSKEALDTLVAPTFRGLREAGFSYVKVDQLRHYLYDNLHCNPAFCAERGVTPAEMFRKYLGAARAGLGPDVFLLSCWGVLPESVGIADACRIGGDGYGPVTMQQYNSWNGIVWRNDPDHCDVYPRFKPAESGNVTQTAAVAAAPAETIIRPALASIAGCLLMLSDKPAVYRDDANLNGLRRAAPVLFSVPGQLYDFDESKTRKLATMRRSAITSGANPSPIDGDQFGPVCPWWLNEFDRPFEHWNVLHRLNWSQLPAAQAVVRFADVGLDPARTYLVYEFWTRRFLGTCRERVKLPELNPMGLCSLAIREQLDRPQILSTSRHLSQGGVDLVSVEWQGRTLSGRSRVVAGDPYELVIYLPAGFRPSAAEVNGQPAQVTAEGELARVSWMPVATGEVNWKVMF